MKIVKKVSVLTIKIDFLLNINIIKKTTTTKNKKSQIIIISI